MDLAEKEMEVRTKSNLVWKIVDNNTSGLDGNKLLSDEYFWISQHRLKKFRYLFYLVARQLHETQKQIEELKGKISFETTSGRDFGFYRDVFFFYGASILDVFAREISCFYSSFYNNSLDNIFSEKVYFGNFVEWLNGKERTFDKTLPNYLNKQKETWVNEFLTYRQYVVHIGTYDLRWIKPDNDRMYDLVLPDNPKLRPDEYTYDKKIETMPFCDNFIKELIEMFSHTFDNVITIYK